MYNLSKMPEFMPNIESIPSKIPTKAKKPTVCFIGRLDKRKRPELFIKLADKFPGLDFIVVGKAEESARQHKLERLAKKYKNISMLGYVDKFDSKRLYDVYNKSWILINTSAREGLPLTFVEAAGRGCAILSYANPDDFASKFGFWAKNENFEEGLRILLRNNYWEMQGIKGFNYVKRIYSEKNSLNTHLKLYKKLRSM